MGYYVRAEIFELVRIFTLNKLSNIIDKKTLVFTINRKEKEENYRTF